MQKKFLVSIVCLFSTIIVFGQVPQGMSYQAIALDPNTNLPVTNQTISLKFSILDNSAIGSVVYSETFMSPVNGVTTNALGVFSLNIGTGTPIVGTFSSINWGLNQKFLKVEMDIATGGSGTNYTLVGTNQLMSVPYALYSLNSQIKVFNNINDLRNTIGIIGEIAYIKGHTTPGDGGEGSFIWKELPIGNPGFSDNNGTIIRNANNSTPGWIRIIDQKINVKYFGIKFDNTDGVVIQKAIDFAALNALNPQVNSSFKFRDYTNCGSTVYIPEGDYNIGGTLTIKRGVNIEGNNMLSTSLKATNETSGGSMIELDAGQVSGVNISNLTLDGNTNSSSSITKNCMNLVARSGNNFPTGGLWNSNFKNIQIRNFNGYGIILEGGGINDETRSFVNQDCIFENVNIRRQTDNSSCLLIRGNLGQFTFIHCGFDGYTSGTTNPSYTTSKFFNVAIESNVVEAAVIKFLTCTFQYSEYGVYTSFAESVTFDNCWFEYLDTAIAVTKAANGAKVSKCINILNCRFANASGFGSEWTKVSNSNHNEGVNGVFDAGSCISVEGGAQINALNNFVITSTNNVNPNSKFIKNYGLDSVINASNNVFSDPSLGKTFGIANNTISTSGNILNTLGYKFVSVNGSSNNIKEIKSEISVGETITIRATGTGQVKFDNSKNILFAKTTVTSANPFVLNPKETATFIKIDDPITISGVTYHETYQLISANKLY